MVAVQRGLLVLMAAGALPSRRSPDRLRSGAPGEEGRPVAAVYDASQKEAYLTPDELDYIRPASGSRSSASPTWNRQEARRRVQDHRRLRQPARPDGATTVGIVTTVHPGVWDGKYYTDQLGIGAIRRATTRHTQTIDIATTSTRSTRRCRRPSTRPSDDALRRLPPEHDGTARKNFYFRPSRISSRRPARRHYQVTTTGRCNQCHDPLALHGGTTAKSRPAPSATTEQHGRADSGSGASPEERSPTTDSILALVHAAAWEGEEITYPQLVQKCETCHDPAATGAACGTRGRRAPRAVAATSTSISTGADTATPTSAAE